MKILLIISFILILFCAKAQNNNNLPRKIDSIQKLIQTSTNDTVKIAHLSNWDDLIYFFDIGADTRINQEIIILCEKNLKNRITKPEQLFYKFKLAKSINNLGVISQNKGDYNKAVYNFNRCLKIYTQLKNRKGIGSCLGNIGSTKLIQGNYIEAIDYTNRSLKIYEEIHDSVGIALSLGTIGTVYQVQGDLDKNLEYLERCLKMNLKINDLQGIAYAYSNIGLTYQLKKQYTKAMAFQNKALKIYTELNAEQNIANTLSYIGTIQHISGDRKDAREVFEKALAIYIKIEDKKGIAQSDVNIGAFLIDAKNYTEGIPLMLKALKLAREIGEIVITEEASRILYLAYKTTGKFKESLEMYQLYIELSDKMKSENSKKELVRQEFKYAYDKKATADSVRIAAEKKVTEAQLNQEKTQRYALYLFLCLTMVFGIFMFSRFRITRNQKNIIEEQKHIVEQQKLIVEIKQKEVIDSIHYAKRIQTALLPGNVYISRNIQRLKEKK